MVLVVTYEMPTKQSRVQMDDLFVVVAHELRRATLGIMAERETCSLETLSQELDEKRGLTATVESSCDSTQAAFHHIHLPKLDAAGLKYDASDR